MGNKRVLKYIGNSLLVVFLLAAVIILNIAVQKNTTSSDDTKLKTSQQTKLNVAIVNEDQAVRVDKKEYNLGASYVKNIERDNSQNWSVVTRGAADSGLEKGTYQLVLTIPSDFSEKVLDVNSVNADKTTVTYKVNASGNLQVENDANKLAKDIIADLNSQLVDMYMASILSNLYTAQQNVQASSQLQITNIGHYKTNLLDTAINSRNIFPTLFNLSTSSVDANTALKTTLESYSQVFDNLGNSQTSYGNNFSSLLKQRGEDQISYADFMEQLMAMNRDTLSAETKKLYENLQANQEALGKQIGSSEQADVRDASTYAGLTDNVTKQIADLEENLEAERTKFKNHEDNIKEFINKKLVDYYTPEQDGEITLSQVLAKGNVTFLTDAENTLKAELSDAVAELPAENFGGQSFTAFGLSITVPALSADIKDFGTPSDATKSSDLAALAAKEVTTTEPVAEKTGTKAKVSWKAPEGVTVDSVTYNGDAVTAGQEIILLENAVFEAHYSVTNDTEKPSTAASITIMLNGLAAASAPIDIPDLQQAAASYGAKAQKIASAYQRVNSLLQIHSSMEQLKKGKMNDALTGLLLDAIQSNLDAYKESLSTAENASDNKSVQQRLNDTLEQLKKTGPELKQNLAEIDKSNQELAGSITKQLEHYESLKERLTGIATAQTNSTAALAKTDTDLTSLNSEFSSLLTETSGVKASSQSNIQAAESVNQIFSNFNRELATAQGSTEKLSTDAEALMAQFNEELAANGNFVESFVKVLNNAYENGVPNEVLLNFLSSPVTQSSSSVKATVNVYRPFTWILLLEIVSLFTAYLFATQNVIRKVKDRFKLDKLHDTDIMTVGILSFLALTIGLVIGIVSSVQLQVGREYVPSWVLLMAVASFILIQGQYFLLKHIRVIGMGLAFFMMISFVYLSNAIGTTASLTGFPALIKGLNVLSILESLLSGYFDGQTAGFFIFFAMLIVLGLLVAANIFVRPRNLQDQSEKV
ncbi:type VII secretion protein EsaA [Streptococcus cristatus]|uniref:Type VII secretion system accessory factor EsaA n=1 Tax=Streptococcus cristatus TaxID=45634 RepID=A0A139N5Z4_STRCR|nr:type VII secretion protein EsaA [Streptococcus cristatus]KXT71465.1 putative secretion accessory protein EsaA/YueB [Streptococcus cristatus]